MEENEEKGDDKEKLKKGEWETVADFEELPAHSS